MVYAMAVGIGVGMSTCQGRRPVLAPALRAANVPPVMTMRST